MRAAFSVALSAIVSFVVSRAQAIAAGLQAGMNRARSAAISALAAMRNGFNAVMAAIVSVVVSRVAAIVSRFTSGFARARAVVSSALNAIRSIAASAIANIVSRIASGVQNIVSRFTSGFARARAVVQAALSAIRSVAMSTIASMVAAVVSGVARLVSAFRSGMSNARSAVTSGMNAVLSYLRGINLASIGRNMIQGMVNGIRSMAGNLVSSARSVVSGAIDAARSALGIHSPSRVFAQIGEYVGAGFVKGIKGTSKEVAAAGTKMSGLFKQVVQSKLSSRNQKIIFAGLDRWAKKQTNQLVSIAKQRENVAAKLKDASKKLEDALKVRNDYAKGVTDAAMGYGSITKAEGKTGYDIAQDMQNKLQDIKSFQANIKALAKAGLNKTTLADLVNAGVEGGGATAAILASDTGLVKSINSTQAQINSASKSLGNYTADQFHGVGVNAAKGLVKGLKSQEAALKKQADHVTFILTRAIKSQLKVKSPSRVFRSIGEFVMDGLRIGINNEADRTVSAVERVATAMTAAFNPQLDAPSVGRGAYATANTEYASTRAEKSRAAEQRTTIEVPVILNGREIARASNAEQKRMDARENARLAKFANGGGA